MPGHDARYLQEVFDGRSGHDRQLEEAEITLAQLVRRALGGEEVILAQEDERSVKLVPVQQPPGQQRKRPEFGHWKGKLPPTDLERFRPLTDEELREEGFGLCVRDAE